jgi:hypothetical protein
VNQSAGGNIFALRLLLFYMIRCLITLVLSLLLTSCHAINPKQPEEVGTVNWGRDLDVALASSKTTGKPVFALFQEVPGCAGCKQFGRDVLSSPLLVEAIQTHFTPLLIHNNSTGKDAEVLKRFNEPAWNYQVVRFLDADAIDIIPRKDRVWATAPLAERMVEVLTKAKRTIPAYLPLIVSEHSGRLKQAVFTMGCFWTGEMELGKIDGVITTEAGFMAGREVTVVQYDPTLVTLPNLIASAEKVKCAQAVAVPAADAPSAQASRLNVGIISGYRAAPTDDQKRQLKGTPAGKLGLVGAQATKVNAWIHDGPAKAAGYLTPAQTARLR